MWFQQSANFFIIHLVLLVYDKQICLRQYFWEKEQD